MISFHSALSPDRRKMVLPDTNDPSRKRKWEGREGEGRSKVEDFLKRRSESEKPGSSVLDMDLHLETPLPVEWQRCLDIQSGEVHFYNTRTHKRTCKDPSGDETTTSEAPPTSASSTHRRMISLNLELNLQPYEDRVPLESNALSSAKQCPFEDPSCRGRADNDNFKRSRGWREGYVPWLGLEKDGEINGGDEEEMVATVCARCHMLVMLCKSRPTCPNCKFMHPPDHTPPTLLLFKPPKCTLLC